MKRGAESGFAVLETILVLVIVAIVGFAGYYVWHAKQNTDKTYSQTNATDGQNPSTASASLGKVCATTDPAMKGKTFTAPNNSYSFCLPDGWSLGMNDGSVTGAIMAYQPKVAPKIIDPATGGVGLQALGINVGKYTETNYQAGYNLATDKVGSVKAVGMTGTEYKQTIKSEDTLRYTLHFVKGSKSIDIEYQFDPGSGQTDQSSALIAVLRTLTLN